MRVTILIVTDDPAAFPGAPGDKSFTGVTFNAPIDSEDLQDLKAAINVELMVVPGISYESHRPETWDEAVTIARQGM